MDFLFDDTGLPGDPCGGGSCKRLKIPASMLRDEGDCWCEEKMGLLRDPCGGGPCKRLKIPASTLCVEVL